MIGSSSYVTSIKKGRAMMGGCVCSPCCPSPSPIGGPFLPLAGGTMNPSPFGIIEAHTISGIQSLIAVNDTDLNITGNIVIQPPLTYSYPEYSPGTSANAAAQIKNWDNPGTLTSGQYGLFIDTITFNGGNVYGSYTTNITGDFAVGAGIQSVNANTTATGLLVSDVNSAISDADGIQVGSVTGTANTTGIDIRKILGQDSGFNRGMFIRDVRQAAGAGGGESIGCEITFIEDSIAAGDAYGMKINQIGEVNGLNTIVRGIDLSGINGGTATGIGITNVISRTGEGYGMDIDGVDAIGGLRTYGIRIENVSNTGGNSAYGLLMDGISSAGGQEFGVVQNGFITSGNYFQSKVEVGNAEPAFGGVAPSLNVVGTIQTTVQPANPGSSGYVVEENKGNIVVSTSAVNTHFVMPIIKYTGAKYTFIKTHAGNIAINGNVGANINGVTSPALPAGQFTFSGAAYAQMQIIWIGTEWVATLL